ncbi:MAG: trypsin-like peptidase domain-containing protein [Polyangiaceae bacterium]
MSSPAGKPSPGSKAATILSAALLALILVNVGVLTWLSGRAKKEGLFNEQVTSRVPPIEIITPAQPPEPLPEGLSEGELRTIEVFRQASPSVVFITTLQFRSDAFRRNVTTIPAGTGSGFIWDEQGHVVTNFHVIKDGNAARVTLADQSTYPATLVGHAADKDIAVLKINAPADKLAPLPRGSSETLHVGQQTLAIGNPFGLDHTLSTGVVSGLEREIESLAGRPIFGVIQTDAAINPGNSGGPLLDSRGRVIGINTAIYSPSGASAGIGFAVPIDPVERFVPQLIEHGRIIRPGLGISFDSRLDAQVGTKGIVVLAVQPGSAAEKAGIRPVKRDPQTGRIVIGDIILAIDGIPIQKQKDLFKALDEKVVGDVVKVSVERSGGAIDVMVTLEALGGPEPRGR